MIKHLSFLTFFLCSFLSFSQCEVNENQAPFLANPTGSYDMQLIDGSISIDPLMSGYDTLTAFPNAVEGEFYEAVIGIRVPNDTSFVYELVPGEPQLFENVQMNSVAISDVVLVESTNGSTTLPPGFSWDCVGGVEGADSLGNCAWAGGDYGCISLGFDSEVPSGFSGAYRINVLLDADVTYYPLPGVPFNLQETVDNLVDFYVLVIEESGTTSILDVRNFSLIGISPNPAKDYLNLEYGSKNGNKVDIKIYDILGNIVESKQYNSVFGYNEVRFNTSNLMSGIYTLILSNNSESIVERIIID